LNQKILIFSIKTKIDDSAFIDLLHQYLKLGYGKNLKKVIPTKVGVIQG
jgi:hypothetical protein